MIVGNTLHRTKEERRRLAPCFQGNRQVIEWVWGSTTFPHIVHPNRLMRQFRASNNRRRRVA